MALPDILIDQTFTKNWLQWEKLKKYWIVRIEFSINDNAKRC